MKVSNADCVDHQGYKSPEAATDPEEKRHQDRNASQII